MNKGSLTQQSRFLNITTNDVDEKMEFTQNGDGVFTTENQYSTQKTQRIGRMTLLQAQAPGHSSFLTSHHHRSSSKIRASVNPSGKSIARARMNDVGVASRRHTQSVEPADLGLPQETSSSLPAIQSPFQYNSVSKVVSSSPLRPEAKRPANLKLLLQAEHSRKIPVAKTFRKLAHPQPGLYQTVY